MNDHVKMIEIVFGELIDGRVIVKGTLVKMARGEMIRFMAENRIKNEEDIKHFQGQGYNFRRKYSNDGKYVFIK